MLRNKRQKPWSNENSKIKKFSNYLIYKIKRKIENSNSSPLHLKKMWKNENSDLFYHKKSNKEVFVSDKIYPIKCHKNSHNLHYNICINQDRKISFNQDFNQKLDLINEILCESFCMEYDKLHTIAEQNNVTLKRYYGFSRTDLEIKNLDELHNILSVIESNQLGRGFDFDNKRNTPNFTSSIKIKKPIPLFDSERGISKSIDMDNVEQNESSSN